MTRVLITGVAGFLGFHLARHLAARPDVTVIGADNFARGERDPAFAALISQTNVEFHEMDLSNEADVGRLPTDIDYVYHLAALNGTQNFYERPMDVIRFSTLPTLFLVSHYTASPNLKRFVYAGTSEAYASTVTRFGWPVPTAEDVPLTIDDVANPRWSYAGSKLHGEIVTALASKSSGMPFSIIRYHNAYGPRMGDKHVIPDFLARMRNGVYELFGHEDTRSFLYVDDVVRATLLVGEAESCSGEIINVGSPDEITMRALGELMLAVRGVDASITLHPSPPGSVKRRAPDISKIQRLTGFAPTVSLTDGLQATARYYLDDQLDEFGAVNQ